MGRKQRNLTQLNIQRSQAWNRFEDLCNQWQPTYTPTDSIAIDLYYRIITALIDLNETRNQRRAPTDSFRNRLNRVLCKNNLLLFALLYYFTSMYYEVLIISKTP